MGEFCEKAVVVEIPNIYRGQWFFRRNAKKQPGIAAIYPRRGKPPPLAVLFRGEVILWCSVRKAGIRTLPSGSSGRGELDFQGRYLPHAYTCYPLDGGLPLAAGGESAATHRAHQLLGEFFSASGGEAIELGGVPSQVVHPILLSNAELPGIYIGSCATARASDRSVRCWAYAWK